MLVFWELGIQDPKSLVRWEACGALDFLMVRSKEFLHYLEMKSGVVETCKAVEL